MELGARGGSAVRGPLSLAGLGVGGAFLHLPPAPRGTDITPGQSREMRPRTRVGEGFQIGCPHQTQDASFPGQGSPQTGPLCWDSSIPLPPSTSPLITRLPACRKFTRNLGLGLGPLLLPLGLGLSWDSGRRAPYWRQPVQAGSEGPLSWWLMTPSEPQVSPPEWLPWGHQPCSEIRERKQTLSDDSKQVQGPPQGLAHAKGHMSVHALKPTAGTPVGLSQ